MKRAGNLLLPLFATDPEEMLEIGGDITSRSLPVPHHQLLIITPQTHESRFLQCTSILRNRVGKLIEPHPFPIAVRIAKHRLIVVFDQGEVISIIPRKAHEKEHSGAGRAGRRDMEVVGKNLTLFLK